MQTPFLIVHDRHFSDDLVARLEMEGRSSLVFRSQGFAFVFFPPEDEESRRRFKERICLHKGNLHYEDGFMLRYPEPCEPRVERKLDLFDLPSTALDGAFSRIRTDGHKILIDGSLLYLQLLFSLKSGQHVAFGNYFDLIKAYADHHEIDLTYDENFFASHLMNATLAFYLTSGTPFREIRVHDSAETLSLTDDVASSLNDKITDPRFAALDRDARILETKERLAHGLD